MDKTFLSTSIDGYFRVPSKCKAAFVCSTDKHKTYT